MQSTSPRLLCALSLSLSIGTCLAQNAIQAPGSGTGGAPAPAGRDPKLDGLPAFLVPVPAGNVELGMTAQELVTAVCEVAFPSRPDQAIKAAAKQIEKALKLSGSVLGRKAVPVEPFLLAKWPVTCGEYDVLVALSRGANSPIKAMRAPFHEWRYGRKDDYEKRLPEINQMFPNNSEGPVRYWEQKGAELPYKLVDKEGKSIADMPVSFVTYSDANTFAGYYGMRLPTEAEWTRAAKGDGQHAWPFGTAFAGPASLKQLKLYEAKDKAPKPVNTVPERAGPYGHSDMFGSIWQMVAGLGYGPINGPELFASEWKVLQKDKAGQLLSNPPAWRDTRILTKGGCYMSGDDPIQLLVDQRASILIDDVLEGAGFRLAKSLRPGYDTLYSLLKGVYNRAPFQVEQDIDLAGQIGAERYEIGANGFPTSYQTISFAPANWLAKEKNAEAKKLLESSLEAPLLLGTLVSTERFADALDVKGRIFTLLYRDAGMPKVLAEAIKRGHKEVQEALKAAAKKGAKPAEEEAPKDEADDKKDDKKAAKKENWREVLKRYGLEEKDLEPKDADKLDFVRIDGVKVPTEKPVFLLHGNDGKIVGVLPATNQQPAAGKPAASTLTFEDNGKGKAIAKFHFGVQLSAAKADRFVDFQCNVLLDTPAPAADKPWRVPN